jgi:hypothetical protein
MGCGASSAKAPPARQTDAAGATLKGDAMLEPVVNTEKPNGDRAPKSPLQREASIERLHNEAATTASRVRRKSFSDPGSPAIELPADDAAAGSSSSDPLSQLANMSLERLTEEFEKCDTSGDRRLSIDELSNLLVKLFGKEVLTAVDVDGKCVVDSLLAALDTDGSGDVDLDELEAAWRAWFGQALNPKRCLLIIDVQNDFIDGTLGLKGCPAGQVSAGATPREEVEACESPADAIAFPIDSRDSRNPLTCAGIWWEIPCALSVCAHRMGRRSSP